MNLCQCLNSIFLVKWTLFLQKRLKLLLQVNQFLMHLVLKIRKNENEIISFLFSKVM